MESEETCSACWPHGELAAALAEEVGMGGVDSCSELHAATRKIQPLQQHFPEKPSGALGSAKC